MPLVWRMVASATIALTLCVGGCSALDPCDRSDGNNPADPYRGGTSEQGSYMSSPWTGPWLPFAGGQRYTLYHGLGCTPRLLECWESFSSDGIGDGSIAPPAGNMCLVQEINDEYIVIKNDTCSDLYVLVTAWAPSCSAAETKSINTSP